MNTEALIDQAARDRFVTETENNFSVIAPAGVGKTTSIVRRIAQIAQADVSRDEPVLPRLVMVTYTNKAANEMEQRARQQLMEGGGNAAVLAHFNRAFFGTIHSFCMELLRGFGHLAGLPSHFQLAEDEEALWLEFLRATDSVLQFLPEAARASFARHASLNKALQLVHSLPSDLQEPPALRSCPQIDLNPILNFVAPNKRSSVSIAEAKQLAQSWQNAYEAGEDALPPINFSKGGKAFQEEWNAAFQPLRDWLGEASLHLAYGVAQAFRQFRVKKGVMTYDDMIWLTTDLLRQPAIKKLIQRRGYCVILDEAQDTDPLQFEILLNVASEVVAEEVDLPQPGAGRFCMVGDPQQSIFSGRADIDAYLKIHDRLCEQDLVDALTFEVTMRCDREIVAQANRLFPQVLKKQAGQVDYVPLAAKPTARVGEVSKVTLPLPEGFKPSRSTQAADQAQALAFANWLAEHSPADFGVQAWDEIAVLCPRNDWLANLAEALNAVSVPVQSHSKRTMRGDSPAYAWFTALLKIMAFPQDAFEVAGVLRELFGLSDDVLAWHVQQHLNSEGKQHPLAIRNPIWGESAELNEALDLLWSVQQKVSKLPLREAAHQAVAGVDLRGRLLALPDWESEQLLAEVDELLLQATLEEEKGSSLADWVARLEHQFESGQSDAKPLADHLQLFSCHKSKGLEWKVVLVPFLFKPIGSRTEHYPKLIPRANGEGVHVAYDKYHTFEDAVLFSQRKRFFENQRLAYVTVTRAAQRLIFIDDEAFYAQSVDSFADCLSLTEGAGNRTVWSELPLFEKKVAVVEKAETQPEARIERQVPLGAPAIPVFPKRVLPSSLADHSQGQHHQRDEADLGAEPEFPEVRAEGGGSTGADYGNWWHDTMEHLPWAEGVEEWKAYLAENVLHSPDSARAEAEVARFLNSEVPAILKKGAYVVRTELPFLWRKDEQTAFDGFIDFAAYDEKGERWLVIDWKTDRVENRNQLLNTYRPQIQAYLEALAATFEKPVTGYLYSTRLGLLLEC